MEFLGRFGLLMEVTKSPLVGDVGLNWDQIRLFGPKAFLIWLLEWATPGIAIKVALHHLPMPGSFAED